MLADKLGVISLPDAITTELLRRWRLIGIDSDRIISVKTIDISVLELLNRKDEFEAKFIELARKQIDEEGAQAIVPGCGLYQFVLGLDSREKLEGILGVPVIYGAPLVVKFTEMLVSLKMSHSKKAYPK